jgi:ATP-dependent RNA helicase DeaD
MSISNEIGFADMALLPAVIENLSRIGYEKPSPVQAKVIPHMLEGRDVLGTAQTGTGKTAAFALPTLTRLDLGRTEPQVLVLTPTRELAMQVSKAYATYAGGLKGYRGLAIYGGQGFREQLRDLKRGVHVVVGTPGRIMDHLRRGTLKLDSIQTIVLDEADEMLRMGFIDDVTWILEQAPAKRQVALLSATMPAPIRRLADRYLTKPVDVKIGEVSRTCDQVIQSHVVVQGMSKQDALLRLLDVEDTDGVIVFVRTKAQTAEIANALQGRGLKSACLNGDMTQTLREQTVSRFKSGRVDVLVATDVAARGLDVARVSHVINFDVPGDSEAYVHRIGRTGRAGREGKAILLVQSRERRQLQAIERSTKQKIPAQPLPTLAAIRDKRLARFKDKLSGLLAKDDREAYLTLTDELLADTEVSARDLAAALLQLVQKDEPLLPVTEPEPVFREPRAERSARAERPARAERSRKPAGRGRDTVPMESFRIAVGRQHKVRAGDIVGAIANEIQLDSSFIGRIQLRDDHSIVDLPVGMPREVLRQLKRVYVRNHPMNLERVARAS